MAELEKRDYSLAIVAFDAGHSHTGGCGGIHPVAESICHCEKYTAGRRFHHIAVTVFAGPVFVFAGEGPGPHAELDKRNRNLSIFRRHTQATHFFIVTVVPFPTVEATSNSSIRRREPGNPSPIPL